ncbi:ferritin-like domain-containing protein [Haloarcula sediminis]|uniref:ferritin-like domain-containing protein n=1 Tax=Haloarcula sediminis TaxID=3111777 RepID=UPI002D77AD1A|nr:ferritin-like domain-containing protein [Haloarcula sp. CK38]
MTNEDTNVDSDTRRRFLAGTAGALGGVALGGAFATPALAEEHDTDSDEEDSGPPEAVENEFEDDVDIFNYALTLEYLEAAFYEAALDNVCEEDLVDDGPLADFGDPITDSVYENLETIRDHERTHAETLASVIESLDGEPVDEPEFDFGSAVEEPDEFIATAVQLEDTGVSAYAGAAPFIEDDSLVPPALSIHSVEARHAAYLRALNGQIPFPEAYDDPRSRSEVLDIASPFIVE